MLKVVHIPFTFGPDPVGGTEIYVEALAQASRSYGIEPLIAAPSCKGTDEVYEYHDLRVRRYLSAPESGDMLGEIYGQGDPKASLAFGRILDEECPNVVHIHAFTRAVSVLLVREAKQRGLAVFFTYHTPTASCNRGSLMLLGKVMCDGKLHVRRCTNCSLEARGLPRWASVPLTYVPSLFARTLAEANLSGGMWTALRLGDLIRMRSEAFQAITREVDGIVALCEWVQTLLITNGVPLSKITLSQHGLPNGSDKREALVNVGQAPLRVAFFGRSDREKGIDTLINAVRGAPDLNIELHLYGVTQSKADQMYWTVLQSLAANDRRITFLPPVSHDKVVPLLRQYHILAVPSRWMETGPLVILESFSAGTPVIGSDLGGIAELVQHEKNGLLVHFEDVSGWANALNRCAEDRQLLAKLRAGVEPPRRMGQVAHEMAQMYYGHINARKDSCSSDSRVEVRCD